MQTLKLRPLLPTLHAPAYLQAAMTSAKSLFWTNLRVTPTRSRFCAENLRNFLKTRNRREEGGTSQQNSVSCHPERSDHAIAGCPTRTSFGRVGLFAGAPPLSPVFRDRARIQSPSFPQLLERIGVLILLTTAVGFSQQPLTDPTKLQSRNVENMQNFTI